MLRIFYVGQAKRFPLCSQTYVLTFLNDDNSARVVVLSCAIRDRSRTADVVYDSYLHIYFTVVRSLLLLCVSARVIHSRRVRHLIHSTMHSVRL